MAGKNSYAKYFDFIIQIFDKNPVWAKKDPYPEMDMSLFIIV